MSARLKYICPRVFPGGSHRGARGLCLPAAAGPTMSTWSRGNVQAGDRRPGARPGAVGVAQRGRGAAGCAPPRSVPTDQIQSIRYDGQSASFQLAEARESSGQLAEAAELFKKAATESAGKPFPLQAAQFREAEVLTDLAAGRA